MPWNRRRSRNWNTIRKGAERGARSFWRRWTGWFPGSGWRSASNRSTRGRAAVAGPIRCGRCCTCTQCTRALRAAVPRPERSGDGGSALRGGVGASVRGSAADGCAAGRGVAFGDVTILKFRHLLEKHGLGEGLFAEINAHLASLGHSARKGTIVDATIIEAPSSTKNAQRERDPAFCAALSLCISPLSAGQGRPLPMNASSRSFGSGSKKLGGMTMPRSKPTGRAFESHVDALLDIDPPWPGDFRGFARRYALVLINRTRADGSTRSCPGSPASHRRRAGPLPTALQASSERHRRTPRAIVPRSR